MRKQKVITVVLASGMLIACFSGCGFKKVTAEDLVNNACNMDAIESLDADIALVMDVDIDVHHAGIHSTINRHSRSPLQQLQNR